jgi:pantetheine-phosphate adenylyltransferase
MHALYSGSFDPPTSGHADIIHRAASLCSKLTVAIAINPNKKSLFSPTEKEKMLHVITSSLSHKVEILSHDGLICELAKNKGVSFLIRGIRSGTDYEHELQMAIANRRLSGIETLFLMADENHIHISSTLIREIGRFGGSLKGFVPHEIEAFITDVLLKKRTPA